MPARRSGVPKGGYAFGGRALGMVVAARGVYPSLAPGHAATDPYSSRGFIALFDSGCGRGGRRAPDRIPAGSNSRRNNRFWATASPGGTHFAWCSILDSNRAVVHRGAPRTNAKSGVDDRTCARIVRLDVSRLVRRAVSEAKLPRHETGSRPKQVGSTQAIVKLETYFSRIPHPPSLRFGCKDCRHFFPIE